MGTSAWGRRVAGVVLVMAVVAVGMLALAGCAGRTAVAGTRLPARPAELRLDGVEPCALLTEAQVRRLGVRAGQRTGQDDRLGAAGCRWSNLPGEMPVSYLARLVVDRGADAVLNGPAGASVVTVDGFAAVETAAPMVDPRNHCVLLIDVARGQSLWVQWLTLAPGHPGLTHELACRKAIDAARLMLGNLRGLSR